MERPIIWVNALHDDADRLRLMRDRGWETYNAPRPIPGEFTWEGSFRHGAFYGAGEAQQFQVAWENWDAWPVQIITNDEIVDRLNQHAKTHPLGDRFSEFVREHGYKELAQSWLGLPFHGDGFEW